MGRWRWQTNLPQRYDPPAAHTPTRPDDRSRLDGEHHVAGNADPSRPRNRSRRFPDQAGEQR